MTKSLMIQGTMSNAGKSLITAALCRIFKQDGYSCSPFKSQNMALNSYVTVDGHEIGRAQAMQAEAAGKPPSVLMNPILLKPTTDIGSQVIVNGEAKFNMKASDYFKYKKELLPEIIYSYKKLSDINDIIVIEGAGSPVELNLKDDDIVNMGMAEIADAPVIIVGDINRGGVFAQLLGTYWLLDENEKKRVKGFVVNKFRGDKSLFETGIQILEEKSGIPVIGVIPHIDVDIDDEDSLTEKFQKSIVEKIDIAVISLPKISNFTDFDVFSQYEDVSVRYVQTADKLKNPDMIIIPGTKNTISDMKHIRENGLEAAIRCHAENGTPIFGICGGYQMLGKKITDVHNCECGGEIQGMGLLDCETFFEKNKKLTRVTGRFENIEGIFSELNMKEFEGYEIHMGRTEVSGAGIAMLSNSKCDGAQSGNIYGSYVHGIFDRDEIAGTIIKALCTKKGLTFSGESLSRKEYKEKQYDILAETVRNNINMDLIYKILNKQI